MEVVVQEKSENYVKIEVEVPGPSEICHLCLAVNRRLQPVNLALLNEFGVVTDWAPMEDVKLCWECDRKLFNLHKFTRQAKNALAAMEDLKLCQDNNTMPSCLSTLSSTVLVNPERETEEAVTKDETEECEKWGAWTGDITATDIVKVEMGSHENDDANNLCATDNRASGAGGVVPASNGSGGAENPGGRFEAKRTKKKDRKKRAKGEKVPVEHVCATCGKNFRDRHKLVIHERIHTGEFFSCDHCTRKFRDKYKLGYHLRKIHQDTTKPTKTLEISASAVKKEKKPSQCNICFKEFKFASNLRDHMKSHSEERPEMCEVCGKCFKIKQVLKLHMQLHDEKKFKCEICNAKFQSRSGLWEHRWTHTKEKPFKCTLCSASFKWEVRLRCHMKMHDGSNLLACDWCEKVFPRKWMLRSHVERKHAAQLNQEAPVA